MSKASRNIVSSGSSSGIHITNNNSNLNSNSDIRTQSNLERISPVSTGHLSIRTPVTATAPQAVACQAARLQVLLQCSPSHLEAAHNMATSPIRTLVSTPTRSNQWVTLGRKGSALSLETSHTTRLNSTSNQTMRGTTNKARLITTTRPLLTIPPTTSPRSPWLRAVALRSRAERPGQ